MQRKVYLQSMTNVKNGCIIFMYQYVITMEGKKMQE